MKLRRIRSGLGAVVAVTAVIAIGASSVVLGHAGAWVFQDEGGLDSSAAIESASSKPGQPNLCEGINGIPFGGDPGWVRTNGSPDPGTPFVEARGQVLPDLNYKTNPFVTHTDAPFNHYSHDLNVFLTLDDPFRQLLASGNFLYEDLDDPVEENEHSMLELEWERGGLPLFAYPSQSDRVTTWGPHIWDCGHGEAEYAFDPQTQQPVLVRAPTYRTEIHSPVGWVAFRNTATRGDRDVAPPVGKREQDPWVWFEPVDHQGIATTLPSTPLRNTPVQATVADAFFSTFGGNIPESLNGCDDSTAIADDTVDAACLSNFGGDFEWAQPLLNQDYSFFVPAPPKPGPGPAVVVWESVDRCGEVPHNPGNPPGDNVEDVSEADDGAENIGAPTCNIPDEVVEVTEDGQPGIRVTVKAATSDATYPANNYVAFAKTYKVAWDQASSQRPRVFDVTFDELRVFDDTEDQGNDGEWVVSLTANERWVHPVRGSGDDNDPFWENGALDDGCDDDDACGYAVNVSFSGIGVVPNEPLNVKMRGWDDDTTFIQDNDVNEILPVVNIFHPLAELPGSFTKQAQNMPPVTDDGSYSLRYTVTETTPAAPTSGTLTIGDPKYGPNADTGGVATRVSAATPITFSGSDGATFEYKLIPDGGAIPAAWVTDPTAPFDVSTAGLSDGRYTIVYRPVSAGGVVGTTSSASLELDTTPPAVTVPADFEVYATQPGGAVVTYATSATDNLPGPVTSSCAPPSGSLFPNGANAPLTTTVTCTAVDAVGNSATETFDVTVVSPFGYLGDSVVLGEQWARLGSNVQVGSGNVGAFDQSAGIPTRPGVEVEIGARSSLVGGPQVAAHTVRLDSKVQAGDVFHVDGVTAGPQAVYTPKVGYVPLFTGMPAFPAFSAGGAVVDVAGAQTLAAGTYGAVSVRGNSVLTLTGGDYYFTSLEVKGNATVEILGPTTIHVVDRARVGGGSIVGPAPSSGLSARDLRLYVAGADGQRKAIEIGGGSSVSMNAFAKFGTVAIGADVVATGAFIGRAVDVDAKAVLNLDSAFLAP